MRSTTIMGPEQRGHGGWLAAVAGRSRHDCMPSSERQRWSEAARRRLAKRPKWRMRTRPLGRTWIRKRRRNSSAAEGDAMVLASHETLVGDGDVMGISGQIVENVFSTAEGRLGVDDPVLSAELPE